MLLENLPYPEDVRVRFEAQSLARAGHHVTVVAPRAPEQPRRDHIAGVNVVRYRRPDGSRHGRASFIFEYLVAGIALHLAALRQLVGGATVLHLHNPPDVLFPAGALYRLLGRKVMFDHHDLFPDTVELKFGRGLMSRIGRFCQRMTFAVANHVISTNASYARIAVAEGRHDRQAVTIVRNGPPSAWTQLALRQRDGSLDDVHLAYLGRISAQDGLDGIVPVIAHLCREGSPVEARLTVIGDGDARPEVERQLAELGLADRVSFSGLVPHRRIPELLRSADICVDPAPATEVNERSTMTKISEYLALGKPVVAYDLLETKRTVGDAGLLVPRGDIGAFAQAIVALATDSALRRRLGQRARDRAAASLTWEHSEPALLAAYAALRTDSPKTPRGATSASSARRRRDRPAALGALVAVAVAALVGLTPTGAPVAVGKGRFGASVRPAPRDGFTGLDGTVHHSATLHMSHSDLTDRANRRARL
jgi:glycosyltransferase involved in cell wall biosynthesis